MKLFVLIAGVFFAAQSCKLKQEECNCVAISCAQDFIYWGGPYAADGIG